MKPETQWISIKEAIDLVSDREILPKHAVAKLLDALIEERVRSRARVFTRRTSESLWQGEDWLLHGSQWSLARKQDGINFYESELRYGIDYDNGIGQIYRDAYRATDVEVYRPHLIFIWPETELASESEPAQKSYETNAVEKIAPPAATGVPGRPSSMYIVAAEFERRAAAGERYSTKIEWAKSLDDWFRKFYGADYPPLTRKTIENNLRDRLAGFLSKAPKSRPK